MALLGQASGGFTESSSALRILHVGVRNTVGQLHSTAFTQSNPVCTDAAITETTQAPGLLTNVLGVLSGSIAFTKGTSNEHGGPLTTRAAQAAATTERVLGVFINNASGNAFENQPGVASNRGPYVSAQGTFANLLYETGRLDAAAALTIPYAPGVQLIASVNGFLTSEVANDNDHGNDNTVIGIVKIAPDSTSDELVYDQRI
tara:strand:- start:673 stop:1281 length:609 start_codon:yes stop_codon:yes gene_type:complete